MKVGDYRENEIPFRVSTRRELDAQKIICQRRGCEQTAIIKLKVRGPWLCNNCAKILR